MRRRTTQRDGQEVPGQSHAVLPLRAPVKVVGELVDWVGHLPERVEAMRDGLADLERRGLAVIYD